MRLTTALLALLPLVTACGGSSDPSELTSTASKALATGDFAGAKSDFDAALEAIGEDAQHPDYLKAKMGAIEARTKDEAKAAVSMFLALHKKVGDKVGAADFNLIGGRLGDSGNFDEAIELAKAGMEAFPGSTHLETLVQRLGDMAASTGSSAALDALRGLGYVGD